MITYNEEFYDTMNKDILEVSKSDEITTEELERRVINISWNRLVLCRYLC